MMRSTDRGAPVLSGQKGKMCDLLMKALVEGFPQYAQGANGANASTGDHTTVTLHLPGHPFMTGQEITVTGLDAEFNGNWIVSSTSADYLFYVKPGTSSYPSGGSAVVSGEATVGTAISVTRVGTTVTVVMTGHGFSVGHRAKLHGANQPEYNGWQTITTVANANTFTFELPAGLAPVTPATGTVLVRYGSCSLGWTLAFSGTNRRIFRQGAKSPAIQAVLCLYENDTTYHEYGVGMTMAENATALDTLVNPFYATEYADNTGMFKSGEISTAAREWVVLGDHRTAIITTKPQIPSTANLQGWEMSYFGDIISYLPGDTNPQMCAPCYRATSYPLSNPASTVSSTTSQAHYSWCYDLYAYASGTSDGNMPARMSKNHLAQTGKINVHFFSPASLYNSTQNYSGMLGYHHPSYSYDTYPDPVHGGLNMDKLYVQTPTGADNTGNPVTRGEVRGIWNPGHKRSTVAAWASGDIVRGTGGLAGKVFEVFDNIRATDSWWLLEISDTWGA